jgi:hypothetical protein
MSARSYKPTQRGVPPVRAQTHDEEGPTSIYDSGERMRKPTPPAGSPPPTVKPTPMPAPAPLMAISMKTPANPDLKPVEKREPELPHVRLRAMSELSRAQQPQNLGNLAPPYDPAEARARTVREYLIWGSLAVIMASAIALVVWFVAS